MKKKLSLILAILIIINSIVCISSLAIEENSQEQMQAVEEPIQVGQETIANYNELYGLEPQTEPQIKLNTNARVGTQNLKYLAVFITFKDSTTTSHLSDQQCIENAQKIFNSEELFDMQAGNQTIKVPSLKKYYEMQSYGNLSITTEIFPKNNKGEIEVYVDKHPMEYYLKYSAENPIGYTDTSQGLTRETELINNAVAYVSNQISVADITEEQIDTGNDGIVDAISFFIEGHDPIDSKVSWGDILWSHKTDNPNIGNTILGKKVYSYNLLYAYDYTQTAGLFSLKNGTYGTILHEFGHTLGYRDLYRYGMSGKGDPVGYYDLMATTIGSNPQDLLTYFTSEYSEETNWHSPLPVINTTTKNITISKPNYINKNEQRAIKIQPNSGSNEYFVVEYHEKKTILNTYSADESGLLVYRVNENSKYQGNNGEKDHIFIFRPNETKLGEGKGDLTQATLANKRKTLGKALGKSNTGFDNETIYYADGSNSGIVIEVVSQTNNSVTINISLPDVLGSGTASDPYQLNTADTYIYMLTQDTKNKYYKVMNDIDFKGKEYPKIDFKGTLEGNNKTLKNITATNTGVFGDIGEYRIKATIKNLSIENINITGNGDFLGGFANVVDNTVLSNIHLKSGTVKNKSGINPVASTGGFIGNTYKEVAIENCSSSVEVTSPRNAGGFIGFNQNAIIKNCYTKGKVTGTTNIGAFIGLQSISDNTYNTPVNATYYYTKGQELKPVGGYDTYSHNLQTLPINNLGKGITGILLEEQPDPKPEESQILKGDINGDKKIDTKDARQALLAYVGKTKLTSNQIKAADVDGNGKIDTKDARQILLYYVGKINKF